MSGHSKWATIKRAKGKADAARGKLFSRLIREITVAARDGGGDINANPRLRAAVNTAKSNNMPNKNIDNAIAKGTGQLEGTTYEEITFEAYAPGGVAIVIESLTDNRNRTIAEVKHAISKAGGNLGSPNSVKWMFHEKGVFVVDKSAADEETLMDVALEAGAEDIVEEEEVFEISTPPDAYESVREALEKGSITTVSAELSKVPENSVKVTGDDVAKVLRLMNTLDDLDDTQKVYGNFDISDEDLQAFEG